MLSPNLAENIKPESLRKLIKLSREEEIQQYFGTNCNIEKVSDTEESYHITGTLKSGVMEGGQDFSVNIKTVDVDGHDGSHYLAWQLEEINVNGVDVSAELVAPVFLQRRYVEKNDEKKLATHESFLDNVSSFAIPHHSKIFLGEFSSIDNLAVLIHENAHVKSYEYFTKEEIREASTYLKLVEKLYEYSDPQTAARYFREDAVAKGRLGFFQRCAQSAFLMERVANEAVVYFFNDHKDASWFKTDTDFYRLHKLITTVSLSYMNGADWLLGKGAIDPILIDYQNVPPVE